MKFFSLVKKLVVGILQLAVVLFLFFVAITVGVVILTKVVQVLPIVYQEFATNVTVIVGFVEIIVAIALVISAVEEGLPFLLKREENITSV